MNCFKTENNTTWCFKEHVDCIFSAFSWYIRPYVVRMGTTRCNYCNLLENNKFWQNVHVKEGRRRRRQQENKGKSCFSTLFSSFFPLLLLRHYILTPSTAQSNPLTFNIYEVSSMIIIQYKAKSMGNKCIVFWQYTQYVMSCSKLGRHFLFRKFCMKKN